MINLHLIRSILICALPPEFFSLSRSFQGNIKLTPPQENCLKRMGQHLLCSLFKETESQPHNNQMDLSKKWYVILSTIQTSKLNESPAGCSEFKSQRKQPNSSETRLKELQPLSADRILSNMQYDRGAWNMPAICQPHAGNML